MNNNEQNKPFEELLAELESIVRTLEQGDVALEKAIELYSKGEAIKQQCAQILEGIKLRVDKLMLEDDKVTGVEAFEDKGSAS